MLVMMTSKVQSILYVCIHLEINCLLDIEYCMKVMQLAIAWGNIGFKLGEMN